MDVTKTQAVKLFVALGYNTAGNWTGEKLYKKINNLPNIVEEGYDLKSDELNELVETILHSTDAVCITEDVVEETTEDVAVEEKAVKAPKVAKEPKVKKEKKAKEPKIKNGLKTPFRVQSAVDVVQGSSEAMLLTELYEKADKINVANGHKENLRETTYVCKHVYATMVALHLAEITDNKLTVFEL